ncbi:MAG: hypothetical protein ATN33_04705 [Epulopiscium sp. Nele67-Bin001]|nr:MAG: hypothetical protein ATN33_04705 [Epulopiscium sp. Nele67-Bin001]
MIYIAYGSNLNKAQLFSRCPDAHFIKSTMLHNYELLFRGSNQNTTVATVEPKRGSQVPVTLWDISSEDEANLDCYEGFPYVYKKEYICVDGFNAMMYVMTSERDICIPNEIYYHKIEQGYIDSNLDLSYLEDALANVIDIVEGSLRVNLLT